MTSDSFTVTISDEYGSRFGFSAAVGIKLDVRQAITYVLESFAFGWRYDDSVEMELWLEPFTQDVNGPVELRMVYMQYPERRSVIVYNVEAEVKAFIRCVRATIRRHPEIRYLREFRFIDTCPPEGPISDANLKVRFVATSSFKSLQAWHLSKRCSRRLKKTGRIDC